MLIDKEKTNFAKSSRKKALTSSIVLLFYQSIVVITATLYHSIIDNTVALYLSSSTEDDDSWEMWGFNWTWVKDTQWEEKFFIYRNKVLNKEEGANPLHSYTVPNCKNKKHKVPIWNMLKMLSLVKWDLAAKCATTNIRNV